MFTLSSTQRNMSSNLRLPFYNSIQPQIRLSSNCLFVICNTFFGRLCVLWWHEYTHAIEKVKSDLCGFRNKCHVFSIVALYSARFWIFDVIQAEKGYSGMNPRSFLHLLEISVPGFATEIKNNIGSMMMFMGMICGIYTLLCFPYKLWFNASVEMDVWYLYVYLPKSIADSGLHLTS